MIQIQGIDRVDLTHKIDDVRQRIAAIESRFGLGGDFQTALNRELNRGIAAEVQRAAAVHQVAETPSLLNGTQPVNEADAINSARITQAINSINNNNSTTQNSTTQNNSTNVEVQSGRIMQNNFSDADFEEADEIAESTETLLDAAAARYGVDARLARAIAIAESNMNQNDISDAGAIGVMQLMPETAAGLGVNPYNRAENIDGGVRFLSQLIERFDGNLEHAVAAYNAGPGAVERFGGIPPYAETQAYVGRVMDLYR